MAPLPPLPSMSSTPMQIEDASFILSAQQQQQQQQQRGGHSNNNSWNQQDFQRSGLQSNGANGEPSSQPMSRIGSFKSTLPPLSVDMNALNAAHHAHHQAKMYQQSHGGVASGSNSHSNSIYSLAAYQSNLSSSGRSSGGSSPERTSYLSDTGSNQNARTQKGTTKEKRNSLGNRRADDPAVLAAALLSLNNPASLLNNTNGKDKEKEKEKEKEDTRASKSLATISRRFVEHFGEANTFDYISGFLHVNDVHDGPPVTNRVDGAAEVLGVHVRRIYELIKILGLEILSLVTVRLFAHFF
jgi:hypothetical protein